MALWTQVQTAGPDELDGVVIVEEVDKAIKLLGKSSEIAIQEETTSAMEEVIVPIYKDGDKHSITFSVSCTIPE